MKKNVFIGLASLVFAFIYSCSNHSEEIENKLNSEKEQSIILGKKLEDPYSVKNMKKALQKLEQEQKKSFGVSEQDITTTHLYIKFLPKTEKELSLIKQDTTLILYPYPLDYEILNEGNFIANYKLGEPLYASVSIDKKIPSGVMYEVLENLFIPDEQRDSNKNTAKKRLLAEEGFISALVEKSLELTGNLEKNDINIKERNNSWRPAGRITITDTSLKKTIGIEGLKVRARRWYTTYTGFVDENGYFSCDGTFERPANYSFDFERYHFQIRGGDSYSKKMKGDWNLHFDKTHKNNFAGTVFRAAHHYYYKDIQGLRSPPMANFWKTQIKIRLNHHANNASGYFNRHRHFLGIDEPIDIYNPHLDNNHSYSTTIHELAHASHWNIGSKNFKDSESIVKESWARGVEWALTRMVYPNYKSDYYRQMYTGVVQDMIDGVKWVSNNMKVDYNTLKIMEVDEKIYHDKISGYTIKQIEDILHGSTTWETWKNKIKTMYENPTEQYLDEAFNFWNQH